MVVRQVIKIDEEKCDGCGLCVSPCAEGAIEIINGKARVVREELCDGAGFCIGVCPRGALSLEEREAPAFSEGAVKERSATKRGNYQPQKCFRCGRNEDEAPVFPCRRNGESTWVCSKCLPSLIHG